MAAYYNEHDPYAAQWIRNLIAAGHVAPGEVDERDIRDVHPDDLRGFTQCHFFAGIAVWSHALRSAGWEDDRPVWTGSCPCQPFSAAGRRGGIADERHLWPHWFHLIAECRPPAVLGEQVASKDGLAWFDLVQADLEGAGYAVGASDLCAAGFSGAHIRQRLYFVGFEGVADSINRRRAWSSGQSCSQELGAAELRRIGGLADHQLDGRGQVGSHFAGRGEGGAAQELGQRSGDSSDERSGLADATRERQHWLQGATGAQRRHGTQDGRGNGWPHAPMLGRHAVDWLFCRDGKWRPVEPGTFPLVDETPARVGRLRAYGNALDAETAAEFVAAAIRATADYQLLLDESATVT